MEFNYVIFAAHNGDVAQLARALAWHARGRGFDSHLLHIENETLGILISGVFCLLFSLKIDFSKTLHKKIPDGPGSFIVRAILQALPILGERPI